MRHSFEVECRESGDGKTLRGVLVTEGRAASGGRRELFAPGSVQWPASGVGIALEHHGEPEVRAHPVREPNGEIRIETRATEAIAAAVASGKKWMSVEFVAIRERVTKGGVREILEAMVPTAAIVPNPEYDTTAAEVRTNKQRNKQRRRRWLP